MGSLLLLLSLLLLSSAARRRVRGKDDGSLEGMAVREVVGGAKEDWGRCSGDGTVQAIAAARSKAMDSRGSTLLVWLAIG